MEGVSLLKAPGYLGRRLIPAGHSKRTLAVLRRREARKHLTWFDAKPRHIDESIHQESKKEFREKYMSQNMLFLFVVIIFKNLSDIG